MTTVVWTRPFTSYESIKLYAKFDNKLNINTYVLGSANKNDFSLITMFSLYSSIAVIHVKDFA